MLVTVIDQLDRSASAGKRNPIAISVFAGAGGCSLGFRQANYDIGAFNANDGKHYVGTDAWAHMDSKAGKTMAVFLERYIRPPLSEMAMHEDAKLENIQLSWTQSEIRIQGTNASIRIPRKS
jgi:hypothetical protein